MNNASSKGEFKWMPPGTMPKVGDCVISDGMVYVAKPLPSLAGAMATTVRLTRLCQLFVQPWRHRGWAGILAVVPADTAFVPRKYLQWLSSGKRAPDIEIGYVFLYFYGLERRLLVDRPPADEEDHLLAEVVRLRSIYSYNGSFGSYSGSLLEAVETMRLGRDAANNQCFQPDLSRSSGSMPMPLKIAIGRKVVANEMLEFEIAVAGVIGLPWSAAPFNRFVVDGVRKLFLQLLRPRFEKTFPKGFKLRNRKDSRLRLNYHAASAGLSVNLERLAGVADLPDPETLTWTKLAWLATEVANELQPLARTVARHPQRTESLFALTSCPSELRAEIAIGARNWIEPAGRSYRRTSLR